MMNIKNTFTAIPKKLTSLRHNIGLLPVILERLNQFDNITEQLNDIRTSLGRIETRQLSTKDDKIGDLAAHEFKVFSQFGEDGIIQYLIDRIPIENKQFVEFGVEDYTEANTRFLLENDKWKGLVIDGNAEHIATIRNSRTYWLHNLKAANAFITAENINELLVSNGVTDEIGLLSVDIDGNDYWIWQSIEVISPIIVVIEYNHRFGKDEAVVVPYNPNFTRSHAHPSMIYFGASLKALCSLGQRKGYAFVGCTSNGLNAFFVRCDKMSPFLRQLPVEEGFRRGYTSDALDDNGQSLDITWEEENRLVMSLPLLYIDQT